MSDASTIHQAITVNAGGVPVSPRVWQPTGPLAWHPIDARSAARPWTEDTRSPEGITRVTVKRCCNGCGSTLGDVFDADVKTILVGTPDERSILADVRWMCPVCTPQPGKALVRHPAPSHYLVVEPCWVCHKLGNPCTCWLQEVEPAINFRIECPTGGGDGCGTYEECYTCADVDDEDMWEEPERHGVVHVCYDFGWSVPIGRCWGNESDDLHDAAMAALHKAGLPMAGGLRVPVELHCGPDELALEVLNLTEARPAAGVA